MVSTASSKNLSDIFTHEQLHHAYLLEGEAVTIVPQLRGLLESELGITALGNPDFWHLQFETMTVENARDLRERQANKAFGSEQKKIFIIETNGITIEAQNALLKTLEEPTADSHFFLIMPSRWLLLPTVRSRLEVIATGTGGKKHGDVASFLAGTPAERLTILAPILEEKDKVAALAFVDDLIAHIHQHPSLASEKKTSALKELLQVRHYLNDRAASLKLILEHIALVIPPL